MFLQSSVRYILHFYEFRTAKSVKKRTLILGRPDLLQDSNFHDPKSTTHAF